MANAVDEAASKGAVDRPPTLASARTWPTMQLSQACLTQRLLAVNACISNMYRCRRRLDTQPALPSKHDDSAAGKGRLQYKPCVQKDGRSGAPSRTRRRQVHQHNGAPQIRHPISCVRTGAPQGVAEEDHLATGEQQEQVEEVKGLSAGLVDAHHDAAPLARQRLERLHAEVGRRRVEPCTAWWRE